MLQMIKHHQVRIIILYCDSSIAAICGSIDAHDASLSLVESHWDHGRISAALLERILGEGEVRAVELVVLIGTVKVFLYPFIFTFILFIDW